MKRIILLTTLALALTKAFAQQSEIIYLDYNPDSIVYYPIDKLYIDFDQDGNSDAYLNTYATNGGWWFDCYSLSGWELCWYEDTITPINELHGN